jgi:hypothetical protein
MRDAREDDEPPPSPRDISDAQAFNAWDNVTNRMENNQLHPKVEKQLGPMQSAMRSSIEARGGAPKRAEQANAVQSFNQANRHFEDSHMQSHSDAQPQQPGVPSGKPRGLQIHHVQAAAQAAKGNQYTGPDDDGAD